MLRILKNTYLYIFQIGKTRPMVLIEYSGYQYRRGASEFFYAWIRTNHNNTIGRVSWDRCDDIGYVIKYLVLHNLHISSPRLRRDYVNLSVEDQTMLNAYTLELQDFV